MATPSAGSYGEGGGEVPKGSSSLTAVGDAVRHHFRREVSLLVHRVMSTTGSKDRAPVGRFHSFAPLDEALRRGDEPLSVIFVERFCPSHIGDVDEGAHARCPKDCAEGSLAGGHLSWSHARRRTTNSSGLRGKPLAAVTGARLQTLTPRSARAEAEIVTPK